MNNLLIEEYPLASNDVTFEDGHWWLKTTVKDMAGVGRFVIGMADEITVIDSPALKDYIRQFVTQNLLHYNS